MRDFDDMTYDEVVQRYQNNKVNIAAIEKDADLRVAPIKEEQAEIEAWLQKEMLFNGMKNLPTQHGTAYFRIKNSATVASREDFMSYVRESDNWDLVDARANASAVSSFIDTHGQPPPGVNFTSVQLVSVRKN